MTWSMFSFLRHQVLLMDDAVKCQKICETVVSFTQPYNAICTPNIAGAPSVAKFAFSTTVMSVSFRSMSWVKQLFLNCHRHRPYKYCLWLILNIARLIQSNAEILAFLKIVVVNIGYSLFNGVP